jgi:hypothetical protein
MEKSEFEDYNFRVLIGEKGSVKREIALFANRGIATTELMIYFYFRQQYIDTMRENWMSNWKF